MSPKNKIEKASKIAWRVSILANQPDDLPEFSPLTHMLELFSDHMYTVINVHMHTHTRVYVREMVINNKI